MSLDPELLHDGGNSGYQTINLGYLLYAPECIVLLGYDFGRGPAGETHWHGAHPGALEVAVQPHHSWAYKMQAMAADLEARGVQVFNASRQTTITCFQRATLEEIELWLKKNPQLSSRSPDST